MAKTNKNIPTYSIKNIRLENFKGIKLIELEGLPKEAKWIFLTGENGFGKTSVLQAIATSLAGLEPHLLQYTTRINNLNLTTKLHSHHEFKLEFEKDVYLKPKGKSQSFSHLSCYGASRLDTYPESSTKVSERSTTQSLYDSRSLLENIEYQLSRWYTKQEDQEFETKFKTTKKLLIDILQIKDILVDFKTDQVSYIEQDEEGNEYQPLPFNQIASGYISLIAMIGDMILKLFRTQPDISNPSELSGIVIIDELDLHFHPKWQRRLPGILSKYFPKIQFIASTHSPIPLLGAPPKSVFLTVDRSKELGITIERLIHLEKEITTLTPNLILDSPIFGYAELFSTRFRSNQSIKTEESRTELNFNKQLEDRLEEGLSEEKKEEIRKLISKE